MPGQSIIAPPREDAIRVADLPREEISRLAYEKAWNRLAGELEMTPDEKALAPGLLREHIQRLIEGGEINPEKAACEALGLVRQQEQILRSQARVRGGEPR